MSIKQELREFYKNQGITGKALRSAMRYDLRSIRKQRLVHHRAAIRLTGALCWASSVEGTGYWVSRSLGRPIPPGYRGYSVGPLRTIR